MGRLEKAERVGLRDKQTGELIAVYPEKISGTDNEIEDKVKFWYYQQSCSAENILERSRVDTLNETELKNLQY